MTDDVGCSIAGELLRQNNILKCWRRHYYELKGNLLIEKKKGEKESARFRITPGYKIQRIQTQKKEFAFKVYPTIGNRPIILAADDEDICNIWISKLEECILEAKPCASKPVSTDDFEILKILGRGAYGKVSLVRHKENGQLFAMKAMSKKMLAEDNNIEQILAEKQTLLANQHPFLITAHYTFQTEPKIFIVMDYVPGGELFTRLREESRFTEERTRLVAAELVLALSHLHKNNLMYRDLKPENILFDEDGHVKLTDFGYVKKLKEIDDVANSFCGTPDYLAPEVITTGQYTKAIDWWSLGCVIYEMLVGISPFFNTNVRQMYKAIVQDPVKYNGTLSKNAIDLIDKLLKKNPEERLGTSRADAEEIKAHPFFASINWDDVLHLKVTPCWKPMIMSETDTSMFDDEFTNEKTVISFEDPAGLPEESAKLFNGFTFTNETNNGIPSVDNEECCIPD